MRWTVHGERSLYESDWVSLRLTDIEIPGGPRFEHHVVRMPAPATGVVIHRDRVDREPVDREPVDRERDDPERHDAPQEVLLLWRHRFITDTWGWEIPAGKVEPGEAPEAAAAREVEEETGWRPGPLHYLTAYSPVSGVGDHRFILFSSGSAVRVGEPTDPAESERVGWVSTARLRDEIRSGRADNGLTLTALLWAFTFGVLR